MPRARAEILKAFELFRVPPAGIGSWITEDTDHDILVRLERIDEDHLTAVQLNQLLVLGHEAPVSDGFFRYYWLASPPGHLYDVGRLPSFDPTWLQSTAITSLEHLRWGMYRLYVDGLLNFGNVRSAFRQLRNHTYSELEAYFAEKRFDTDSIKTRGPSLPLKEIDRDSRYLISEMACKSYGDISESQGDLRDALITTFQSCAAGGDSRITIRQLLNSPLLPSEYQTRQQEFFFSADELLDETISTEGELEAKYEIVARKFVQARRDALDNTRYYLSMVGDLDVYVATSMRTRNDFRNMAKVCETIFADQRLRDLNLRYFDPTLSAAGGHEDKGLIECLMVKCAKALVYCAGERDSYGKDAEAAMALSLGKPVIFYCDQEQKSRFYREVHPLSRLIHFDTGVAVGAMVTDRLGDVPELLSRIFENKMQYYLEQSKPGFLRLKEELTNSVVRLQTNDRLLTETFWNHYQKKNGADT